jgi:hypothetical protein
VQVNDVGPKAPHRLIHLLQGRRQSGDVLRQERLQHRKSPDLHALVDLIGRKLSILIARQDEALVAPDLLRLDQPLDQHLPAADDRPE